jgi:hypothetical protein
MLVGFSPTLSGARSLSGFSRSEHLHGQETEGLGNIDCGARKIDVLCIHHKKPKLITRLATPSPGKG